MSARNMAIAAIAVSAAVHTLPGVLALEPVRRRVAPGLSGLGDAGHVALTFDDGPDPRSTPAFLSTLDKYGVKATFFLLGEMLVRAPGLGRELVAAGHEIALHGWSHRILLARGPRATYADVSRGYDTIADITGTPPRWYRPPYGVLTAAAVLSAGRLGLRPVLWSAWGMDWRADATPGSVLATVRRDLAGGGTVLLHDSDCTSAPGSWRATLGALPRLIDAIASTGLTVGPLRDHGTPA